MWRKLWSYLHSYLNSPRTLKTLFWHSNWGRISYFYIQNPILKFKIGLNIVFWHLKSFFDFRTRAKYLILTFKILFFDIRNRAEYCNLTFKILFWHLNWGQLSYFYIQTWAKYHILKFNSKSYFDIQNLAEYHILTFKILFWHFNWGRISYFDIQNPILTYKLRPNIISWHCCEKVLTYWPYPRRMGGSVGKNICYHVDAFLILFNLIRNMTIFWRSWILSFWLHPLSPPRGSDRGLWSKIMFDMFYI